MKNLKSEIQETIELINETTDFLYKNNLQDGYQYLEKTLNVLTKTMNDIYQYQTQGNIIGLDEKCINEVLNLAMKALEDNDLVLLSDILHYDLNELLNKALLSLA